MLRMDRYLTAAVLKALAVIALCLLTVLTLFTLLDELNDVTPGYTRAHAFLYVLFSTPRRLTEALPYSAFLAVLVGLGTLASREELTVLRAAGVSLGRIYATAAIVAAGALTANLAVAEWLAPAGQTAASTLKLRVARGDGAEGIRSAAWHREGDLYTRIDAYGANGELLGVRQYVVEDGELRLSRQAERATFAPSPQGGRWLLRNVVETRLAGDSATVATVATLPWHSEAAAPLLSAKALFDPAKLSFAELSYQIDYRRREGLDAARYQVSFWGKALQPAAILGLVLLAVGFVVGPLREAGLGARLTVGATVGLGLKYALDLFGPMSVVFGIPPWLAMALPVGLCWLAGLAQIRRA